MPQVCSKHVFYDGSQRATVSKERLLPLARLLGFVGWRNVCRSCTLTRQGLGPSLEEKEVRSAQRRSCGTFF